MAFGPGLPGPAIRGLLRVEGLLGAPRLARWFSRGLFSLAEERGEREGSREGHRSARHASEKDHCKGGIEQWGGQHESRVTASQKAGEPSALLLSLVLRFPVVSGLPLTGVCVLLGSGALVTL